MTAWNTKSPGSPPRMRGKLAALHLNRLHVRITPADAGKTVIISSIVFSFKDHPRGCGENTKCNMCRNARKGSPPRMRGKPKIYLFGATKTRITPADAGKTFALRRSFRRLRDHPRGCGENFWVFLPFIVPLGSPPRMRGKPSDTVDTAIGKRITPADAGKTSDMPIYAPQHRDHPRGCGENTKKIL